jgi:hypothetical protein
VCAPGASSHLGQPISLPYLSSLSPPCSLCTSSRPHDARPCPAPARDAPRDSAERAPTPPRTRPRPKPRPTRCSDREPTPRPPRPKPRASVRSPPLMERQLLRFFLLPLFLSLVTDALTTFEDRRHPHELPCRLSLSPPSLCKRAAELSLQSPLPELALLSSSPRSPSLVHCSSSEVAVHRRSSPEFTGARRSSPEPRTRQPKTEPCSSPSGRNPVEPSPSHARTQG